MEFKYLKKSDFPKKFRIYRGTNDSRSDTTIITIIIIIIMIIIIIIIIIVICVPLG